MLCNNCGLDNPEDNLYCEGCGQKMHYSRDRVEQELAEKANKMAEEALEEQTRNILAACIGLFVLAITARLMFSTGDWDRSIILPDSYTESPHSIQSYKKDIKEITNKKENLKRIPIPEDAD